MYVASFLPNRDEEEEEKGYFKRKKKRKKKNFDTGDFLKSATIAILQGLRGGEISEISEHLNTLSQKEIISLTDPVFFWIHIEKFKMKSEMMLKNPNIKIKTSFTREKLSNFKVKLPKLSIRKVGNRLRKSIKMPIKKQFLGYFIVAILTMGSIGSQFELGRGGKYMRQIQDVQQLSSKQPINRMNERPMAKEYSIRMNYANKVAVSEKDFKINLLKNEDDVKTKVPVKRIVKRRTRVMTLSDLPKITDSNFEEIITEIQQRTPYRLSN